jgi:hypothetical protein
MWRHPSGDAHGRSRAREGTTSEVCVIKNCCKRISFLVNL